MSTLNKVLVALEEDPALTGAKFDIHIQNIHRSCNGSAAAILLKSLRTKGMFLNSETYKLLLSSAAEAKIVDVASWAFKGLLLTTASQDLSWFTNVAKAFQDSNEDELHQFIKEVSESTFPKSSTIVNKIILGFAKSRQAEKDCIFLRI